MSRRKIFRFMSKEEFDKYMAGEVLINNTNHEAFTSAVGFCFLDEEDHSPEYAYLFLSGIVSNDVCAIFETDADFKESWGTFADPHGSSFFSSIYVEELSVIHYSNQDFRLIRYSTDYGYDEDGNPVFEWQEVEALAKGGNRS